MPRGPKGERRKADVIGNAVLIGRIATGDIEDFAPEKGHAGGKVGGPARAKALSPEKRAEIAKKAAAARWRNK
jgi:hypothetical protein